MHGPIEVKPFIKCFSQQSATGLYFKANEYSPHPEFSTGKLSSMKNYRTLLPFLFAVKVKTAVAWISDTL
jgi:hypothetical protein